MNEGNVARRETITYVPHVADGPEIVVRIEGPYIMGVSRRRVRGCFFAIVNRVSGDEHLFRRHSTDRGGLVFVPVFPVDAGRIVHVFQQFVFVVRLNAPVNRHGASLLVASLASSHQNRVVQHPTHEQGSLSFRLLRLIVVRVVWKKKKKRKRLPDCYYRDRTIIIFAQASGNVDQERDG